MNRMISRCIVVLIVLLNMSDMSFGQDNPELTVIVPNIKSIKGTMKVCLVSSKSDFLKKCFREQHVGVTESQMNIIFEDLPQGEYAVSIFHDRNNDEKLNTNIVGIPKEPYGFSNNPMVIFGPPNYRRCVFEVNGNKTIKVEL